MTHTVQAGGGQLVMYSCLHSRLGGGGLPGLGSRLQYSYNCITVSFGH